MKILPLGELEYQTYPVCDENGEFLTGVIEISEEDFKQIGLSLKFNADKTGLIPFDSEAANQAIEMQRVKQKRICELKRTLASYTEDFAQAAAGLYIPDIEARKVKFREAHAELRQLEGKPPRGNV